MKKGEHVKCRGIIYTEWKDQVFEVIGEERGSLIIIDLGTQELSEDNYVYVAYFDVTDEPLTKL